MFVHLPVHATSTVVLQTELRLRFSPQLFAKEAPEMFVYNESKGGVAELL